jgi:hypothetical protein
VLLVLEYDSVLEYESEEVDEVTTGETSGEYVLEYDSVLE